MSSRAAKATESLRSRYASVPQSIKRVLAVAGVGISFVLLVLSVKSGISKIDLGRLRLDWLALSLATGMAYFVALGMGWGELTSAPDKFKSFGVWSVTQAVHLLPGGIWTPATRAMSVEGRVSKKTAVVASESLLQLAATAIAGGGMLSLSNLPLGIAAEAAGIATFGLLVFMRERIGIEAQAGINAIVYYLLGRIAYMVSYVAAQLALGPSSHFPLIGWAACISWSIGLVAFFAPGGIGVREAIYVSVLASTLTKGSAQAGALTGRVVMTIAEMAVLGAFGLATWSRRSRRVPAQNQEP